MANMEVGDYTAAKLTKMLEESLTLLEEAMEPMGGDGEVAAYCAEVEDHLRDCRQALKTLKPKE